MVHDGQPEAAWRTVRGYVVEAQRQVYTAVNAAMVSAYWDIGRTICEVCGDSDRAAYGGQVLQYLADKLTAEFGKGFSIRNL